MAEPFLGEIRMFSYDLVPPGWAQCDGQILPITQNPNLYAILQTTFGGDGNITFGLPDLRHRTPIHRGQSVGVNHPYGSAGGEEAQPLTEAQIPAHSHTVQCTNDLATATNPSGGVAARGGTTFYGDLPTGTPMADGMVSTTGSDAGHENMSPFLVLNFGIALSGSIPT